MQLYGLRRPVERRRQAPAGGTAGQRNRKADGWGFPMTMNAAPPIQFFITPEKVISSTAIAT